MENCCKRAADERAEEIARKIVDGVPRVWWAEHPQSDRFQALHSAADIARSTVQKPKAPPVGDLIETIQRETTFAIARAQDEAAIRADEREKAAKRIEACDGWWRNILGARVMCVATATAAARAGEPKTREQVLEEALREVPCSCAARGHEARFHEAGCAFAAARRALEWRP